jgi:hypothetical protein
MSSVNNFENIGISHYCSQVQEVFSKYVALHFSQYTPPQQYFRKPQFLLSTTDLYKIEAEFPGSYRCRVCKSVANETMLMSLTCMANHTNNFFFVCKSCTDKKPSCAICNLTFDQLHMVKTIDHFCKVTDKIHVQCQLCDDTNIVLGRNGVDLQEHILKKCTRVVKCVCGLQMSLNAFTTHDAECLNTTVDCPSSLNNINNQNKDHWSKCVPEDILTQFEQFYCKWKGPRSELSNHLQSSCCVQRNCFHQSIFNAGKINAPPVPTTNNNQFSTSGKIVEQKSRLRQRTNVSNTHTKPYHSNRTSSHRSTESDEELSSNDDDDVVVEEESVVSNHTKIDLRIDGMGVKVANDNVIYYICYGVENSLIRMKEMENGQVFVVFVDVFSALGPKRRPALDKKKFAGEFGSHHIQNSSSIVNGPGSKFSSQGVALVSIKVLRFWISRFRTSDIYNKDEIYLNFAKWMETNLCPIMQIHLLKKYCNKTHYRNIVDIKRHVQTSFRFSTGTGYCKSCGEDESVEKGKIIICDFQKTKNCTCDAEYHASCVGLNKVPGEHVKWYCHQCIKDRNQCPCSSNQCCTICESNNPTSSRPVNPSPSLFSCVMI